MYIIEGVREDRDVTLLSDIARTVSFSFVLDKAEKNFREPKS